MASINNIVATTETEAANLMLANIGEAPISDLDSSTQNDVPLIKLILKNTSRQVQKEGWEFNTDLGLVLSADGTIEWTNPDGSTDTLNVFVPPSGPPEMIRWDLTRTTDQYDLLVSLRPSKQYSGGGIQVFYDRALNRDGFVDEDLNADNTLQINAIYAYDFVDLPESARAFITALAARSFAEATVGSEKSVIFTNDDLVRTRKGLIDDQGMTEETTNVFDSLEAIRMLGHRPRRAGGVIHDNYSL